MLIRNSELYASRAAGMPLGLQTCCIYDHVANDFDYSFGGNPESPLGILTPKSQIALLCSQGFV